MKRLLWGVLLLAGAAFGNDWMQWRGPEMNGTCKASTLPDSWSVESGKHIQWTCRLPGIGSSTPVAAGNRLFLTVHDDGDQLYALCIDRETGKILWKIHSGSGKKAGRGNTMASPSAVTDGKAVWFMFGQGTLIKCSFEGKIIWKRELVKDYGTFDTKFGFSSSPLLHEGTLYLPMLYLPKGEQQLPEAGKCFAAIDAETGNTQWIAERKTEAFAESLDSYITPIMTRQGLILSGADLVTCHNPKTGKEVWRFDFIDGDRKKNWRLISGPVAAGDLVVSAYPRGRTLAAIKPDGSKRWDYEGRVPDVCTPAYKDGLLYVLDGKGRYLTCLNSANGKEIWQEKIPSDKGFFASPLVADGKIYVMNLEGEVYIYRAGEKSELINRIPLHAEDSMASIIAADDSLYIRTPDTLRRIINH